LSAPGSEGPKPANADPWEEEHWKCGSERAAAGGREKMVDKARQVEELEQKYRILVENMGEGLCVLDKNMVITFTNDKFCEIMGCNKDELLDKDVFCFYEGEKRKVLRNQLKKRPKGISSTYILPTRTKNGKEIFISVNGVPLFDQEGKFKGTLAVVSDITERKKLEEKLEKHKIELEEEVEKRTEQLVDLYRGVAITEERNRLAQEIHDGLAQTLATSLLKIDFCERFLDDNPKKAKRELWELRKMLTKGIRVTRHVIFDLRLPKFHRTGFATVLRKYLEEFRRKTGIASILNLKVEESLPMKVQVVTYRIIREAMNNIRKHAKAKNVNLRLRTDKNKNLHLIIEDDGKGFDLKRALTQSKYANNFGLMGMEEQAKLLGGTFAIESTKKQGTKIKIEVPIEERDE
jgi:PAS domain S-box-containing protein